MRLRCARRGAGVVTERRQARDDVGGLLDHVLFAGGALELRLGLDDTRAGGVASPVTTSRTRESLSPEKVLVATTATSGGSEGSAADALERRPVRRPRDQDRA